MADKPTYEELVKKVRSLEKIKADLEKAEAALRDSEEKYRKTFESITDSITVTRVSDGMYRYVNDGYCNQTGYGRQEVIGRTPADISLYAFPEERDMFIGILQKYGKAENVIVRFRRKNGEVYFSEFSAKPIIYGGEECLLAQSKEITERIKAENALKESEQRYRRLTQNSPDMIYRMSLPDGRYEFVSFAAQEMFGQPPQVWYESPILIRELIHPAWQDYFKEQWENLLQGNVPPTYEYQIIHSKKGVRWINQRNILVRGEHGELKAIEGIATDITDRKKTEKEKIEAQKIASENEKQALVGQIAGKIAHDFNNILGIIMGNAELAILDCMDEELSKTLELIYKQTIRGKNLTRNLVAFARDQEPRQEFFKISEKVDLVVSLMKKDLEGVELIRQDKAGVPELLADPGMIEHALVNLIQNAIHATSKTGAPKIILRTYAIDEGIFFEIEDNGCGIAEKHLDKIYEPAFTLKGSRDLDEAYRKSIKGTGYGMANVRKYVEQHRGEIEVKSAVGEGTLFKISFPIVKKELTAKEKQLVDSSEHIEGKTILVVEDEPDIAHILYRILGSPPCSHRVDIANTGEMAMDLFERNNYDFVSLDYVLPGSTDGMDVYRFIREKDQRVPVLFVSGNIEFIESIKTLRKMDARLDHLAKPFRNVDYIRHLNKMINNINPDPDDPMSKN